LIHFIPRNVFLQFYLSYMNFIVYHICSSFEYTLDIICNAMDRHSLISTVDVKGHENIVVEVAEMDIAKADSATRRLIRPHSRYSLRGTRAANMCDRLRVVHRSGLVWR